jgi:predicted AlkP superfamily phosphohydrolase/phosphomutase
MKSSAISPVSLLFAAAVWFLPNTGHAYIGPGAGFALIGSGTVVFAAIGLALITLLLWPLGALKRKIQGKGPGKRARTRRVIIVGLDGLEPSLVEEYGKRGDLPNLTILQSEGGYRRLGTTLPALSPVAWSTFQTGVNPGAHNIFDFLTRDKRVCLPLMASTEEAKVKNSKYQRLLGAPAESTQTRITRKSTPFWKILGERGVHSNIIRVPISYPPEPFQGNILGAMCTPDLKGSQGTFSFYSTKSASSAERTGGILRRFEAIDGKFHFTVDGPPDNAGFAICRGSLRPKGSRAATLTVCDESVELEVGKFSKWLTLTFERSDGARVTGIVRACLRSVEPELELYLSPVNVDPRSPALSISEPTYFAQWLAKEIGPFGTLGLMEDTWGRNEHALDDATFLEQTYLTHKEREEMFFETLSRTRDGVCATVFDASDRLQHMFWRYLDPAHPSPREGKEFGAVIPEMYQKMDRLVGEVRKQLNPDDTLIVMSDHGFSSFRRGINLNRWLELQGLLSLKDSNRDADYFRGVTWENTRAFACGLSGIYLNRRGREFQGVVQDQEVQGLKQRISTALTELVDPVTGERPIRAVYDSAAVYRGLYAEEAPDLIVGYAPGYRVSWESVTGKVEPEVFSDNIKAWSGDHHVDPSLVPGVLFCNRKIQAPNPHIIDLAPSILNLFDVPAPRHMEGKVIL